MLFSQRVQWADLAKRWCDRAGAALDPVNIVSALQRFGWRPPAAVGIDAVYVIEARSSPESATVCAITRTSDEAVEWIRGQKLADWHGYHFAMYPQALSHGPGDLSDMVDPLRMRFFDAWGKELDEQPGALVN